MRPRQEFLQRLRDHGRQRPPRRGGMRTDPRDERHRQLDGEHRGRGGHRNMPGPAGALHVAVRLPGRTAEPAGQLPRGVGCRHTRVQQVRGGVDPLGEHVTTSATGRPTTRHVTNILLDMSWRPTDTPRQFDTPIAQRHLKAEVANCVGGVLSPMLANVYLHRIDRVWDVREHGVLVRYADDVVIMCRSRRQAEDALAHLVGLLSDLGLTPKVGKTRIVHLAEDGEGLDFLGFHHRWVRSQGRSGVKGIGFLARWPSDKAMAHARDVIRELTVRSRLLLSVGTIVERVNRFLRGWTGYFCYGNSSVRFAKIREYALMRLAGFLAKRHKRSRAFGRSVVFHSSNDQLGLISLEGTVYAPRPFRAWRRTSNVGGERPR